MIARNLILGFGMVMITQSRYAEVVPTYEVMTSLFPIQYWGLLFILNAGVFAYGLLAFAQDNHQQYWWIVAAGLLGTMIWSFYTMASFAASTLYIHSFGYSLVVFIHMGCVLMGGAALWQIKKLRDPS